MNRVHKPAMLLIGLAAVLAAGSVAHAQGPVQLLPDDIKWADYPALPPGGQTAVLAGDPGKAGPFAFRFKMPADYKIMPHTHPEDRMYTVISGTLGDFLKRISLVQAIKARNINLI